MIILVRHGQTEANAAGLLQGRVDLPLTDLGRRQAEAAAGVVPPGARIVSSPLRRAVQTAEVLAAASAGDPEGSDRPEQAISVDDRWVELDYGQYDGRPIGDVPGEVWDRWRTDVDFAPPGGESLAECGRRVREACQDIAAAMRSPDAPVVVVVSHVSPIKAAVAWALGVEDTTAWRMFLDVAGVCRLSIGPRGPSLHSFNDRHHLTSAGL
ncbi:MAG TPA: histidine phosphatase family protein [Acidimicrobiales bacterium]|nr:histidine phosphatase family protein [Acidimicrobiales bacterium]